MSAPPKPTSAAPLAVARTFFRPGATVTKRRWRAAFAVAAAADVLQMAVFPAFVEGAASPFDVALDAIVAVSLLAILGFRVRLAFALARRGSLPDVDRRRGEREGRAASELARSAGAGRRRGLTRTRHRRVRARSRRQRERRGGIASDSV